VKGEIQLAPYLERFSVNGDPILRRIDFRAELRDRSPIYFDAPS